MTDRTAPVAAARAPASRRRTPGCRIPLRRTVALFGLALVATGTSGCIARQDDGQGGGGGGVDLTGAGSTFINPIMSKWAADYAARTGIRVNYQSIGSGGGIRQLSEGTVDFGASDSPMNDREEARARGGRILHLPVIIGSVVLAYNLPGVDQPINLTGELIAEMYLGEISRWNDPRIAAVNPGVVLPARDVLPVYRTDGSGTTFIFTSYLATASARWANGPGAGKAVQWPRSVGLGGKGNEGVAMLVKDTPGAIGYTEYAYAHHNGLAMAPIANATGEFIPPTIEATMAAATAALEGLPDSSDLKLSLINQPGQGAYPIASFSWLLVYADPPNAVNARKLADFVRWAISEGDAQARALDYTPIPPKLAAIVRSRIDLMLQGDSATARPVAAAP